MITCPKCHKQHSDGTKFCDSCGTRLSEMTTCPKCGKETPAEFAFCQNCGSPMPKVQKEETPTPQQTPTNQTPTNQTPTDQTPTNQTPTNQTPTNQTTTNQTPTNQTPTNQAPTDQTPTNRPAAGQHPASNNAGKKKFPVMAAVLGGVGAVVLVAVLVIVIVLVSRGGAKTADKYVFYVKDNEIFYTDLKKDSKAQQLTTRLFDSGSFTNQEIAETAYTLGMFTRISNDGKYIFFADKLNKNDTGFSLYFRELAKPEADPIKVDSNIYSYSLNKSSTIVTYQKGMGDVYQYKIGEDKKEKISSDVRDVRVSDDGEKLFYLTTDGGLYYKDADNEKEKLSSDVTNFYYVTKDFKTVFYGKDDGLYKQAAGEDKVKIASEVNSIINIYDSGEIYYTKRESGEDSLTNYVTDDLKDADAALTEPTYPDYPDAPQSPYWWEYNTNEEYDAAYENYVHQKEEYDAECERLDKEYMDAREAYNAKENRDRIRLQLEDETLSQSSFSLYYFDGTESVVLTDALVEDYVLFDSVYAPNAAVTVYEAYNQSEIEKVKLSEIESVYDVKSMVEAALFSSTEKYIAVKGSATVVEQEKEATSFDINESGTVVYYIDDIPEEKDYGELYRITISNGAVGKPEKYDSDVRSGYFINENDYLYFKDCKDIRGDMYVNKNRIDYDVYMYNVETNSDSGKIYYYTDWNQEKRNGTLKVYDGKEAVKVADEVHDYATLPDGRILYLYDYSMTYYRGELHEWSSGENRKLDDDVVCILYRG